MNPPLKSRLVLILCGVVALSLMAQYTIQLPDSAGGIPITGQSLAVVLLAYLLGLRDGSITIAIYLFLGIVGLPVYADGSSGFSSLTGASGGFLYGFLLSCLLTNAVLDNKEDDIKSIFQFMLLCTILILAFGGLHLRQFLDWEQIWLQGIEPFLPGAMIKLLIATIVAYGIHHYILVEKSSPQEVSQSSELTDEEE